jgi:prevent-host-death family protein
MVRSWQLQEAKNRLSEVIERALKEGPQIITRRGVETAVVLSLADYKKLSLGRKRLIKFFQESPLVGVDLDLTRDTSM